MSASHPLPTAFNARQHHPLVPSSNDGNYEFTIRFSTSLPDLTLSIAPHGNPNVASLKEAIRRSLPVDLKARGIRLIHAGKALSDETKLSTVFRRPSSYPASRVGTPVSNKVGRTSEPDSVGEEKKDSKSKGKEVVRDPPTVSVRTYVHCVISDVALDPSEIAAETTLARGSLAASEIRAEGGSESEKTYTTQHGDTISSDGASESSATTPVPHGFDRLLSAGFSVSEVQNLRLQFMAIQAHSHTPDNMPSPETLRVMEDRWLDNSNEGSAGVDPSTGAMRIGDDDAQAGSLDDMLYGAAMGFFWPVGCLVWGMREEGIWSQRRKIAVVVGVALNVGIGLIRYTS